VGERFSNVNRIICSSFCNEFQNLYSTIHRYETNRIRNIAKFFAHLLYTDALPWSIFSCIKLSEEETTSSSRIYLKFLFLELSEWTGIPELNKRLRHKFFYLHRSRGSYG
jgi:pre-mRNA-splicing factor CWC22